MSYKDFDLGELSIISSGMDAYLDDGGVEDMSLQDLQPNGEGHVPEPERMRVASVEQLKGFSRVASDTLVRKSERDLWSLKQDDEGEWVIERLYDDNDNPIKV